MWLPDNAPASSRQGSRLAAPAESGLQVYQVANQKRFLAADENRWAAIFGCGKTGWAVPGAEWLRHGL
jgi:hypothetical protein